MSLSDEFNPPFANIYSYVAQHGPKSTQLLINLKSHIKREYINVNHHREYFKTIFLVLENKGNIFSADNFLCAYSSLCYLVKRLSMQQQELLIANESNKTILKESLNFLFIYSNNDNNTKKAIISIYLLQSDSFQNLLLELKHQPNIIDFLFYDILNLYTGNDHLKEKEINKYADFFKTYVAKDQRVANLITQKAKKLNLNLTLDISITQKKVELNQTCQIDFYLKSIHPERQLQLQPLSDHRQFNNIDLFFKQLAISYPQNVLEGKETEFNWQKRQQYLLKLIQVQKIHSIKMCSTEQHITNAVTCLKSLRTSVLTASIQFLILLLHGNTVGTDFEISESLYLRLLSELCHLIQSGKKILLQHIHYLLALTVLSYLKSRKNMQRLCRFLQSLAGDKNPVVVKCCCDYIICIIIQMDSKTIETNCKSPNYDMHSYNSYRSSSPLTATTADSWTINLFKSFNQSQFSEVRLRNRQNFWESLSEQKQLYVISYLDDNEAKKLGLGYENNLINLLKSYGSPVKFKELNVHRNKTARKKLDENLLASMEDLEEYELEIPNMQMTMIPYKRQKTAEFTSKQNSDAESRISSGETYAAIEALDELEIDLKEMKNGLTKIESLENTNKSHSVIERINKYFANNAYSLNKIVLELEDSVFEEINADKFFLKTFLSSDINITFILFCLIKVKEKEYLSMITMFLNRLQHSIFHYDFATILVFLKCSQKFNVKIIPKNVVEKELISRCS
ncbi:hypothetical protein QEN19_003753 [Hanseniaspora menglaensis]